MIPLFDDAGVARRGRSMVVLLILVNMLAFGFEVLLGPEARHLIYAFGLIPRDLLRGSGEHTPLHQVWLTLLSSMFLHGSWLHLAGNMLVLWVFGDEIEGMLGAGGFLLFYLASGIVAGIGQSMLAVLSGDPLTPTIGASGAIAGIMGAYLVTFPRARVMTLVGIFFLNLPAWIVLGFWIALQWVQGVAALGAAGAAGSHVAVWAHVVGFSFGALFMLIFRTARGDSRPPQPDPLYPFYNRRRPW